MHSSIVAAYLLISAFLDTSQCALRVVILEVLYLMFSGQTGSVVVSKSHKTNNCIKKWKNLS